MRAIEPECIEKLIGAIRESLRLLNEIKMISETDFNKDKHICNVLCISGFGYQNRGNG